MKKSLVQSATAKLIHSLCLPPRECIAWRSGLISEPVSSASLSSCGGPHLAVQDGCSSRSHVKLNVLEFFVFGVITGFGFPALFSLAEEICEDKVHKFELLLITFFSTS